MEQTIPTVIALAKTSLTEQRELSPECQKKVKAICQTYRSYEDFNKRNNPDTDILFASDERKAIMEDYSTLAMLDVALGDNTSSRWLVTLLANLNKFSGSKNMDDGQTENLARLIAQEYNNMKYSVMLLFFYRFKMGYFGKFYGKVDPMVITCALKDFSEECDNLKKKYRNEEYIARQQEEERLRSEVLNKWSEFIAEFSKALGEKQLQESVNGIYIDKIIFDKKLLQLYVTQEQYDLLEKEHFNDFAKIFHKHFPDMSVCYRLHSQKTEQENIAEHSDSVNKKSHTSEKEAGCSFAHAVIENTLNLDKNGLETMRDGFWNKYHSTPEDYLAKCKESCKTK